MPPPPLPPLHPGGPKAQWREAQRLRLAGACLYASAVLAVSCGAAAFLMASVSTFSSSKFSLSAALLSSLFSPRVAVAALLMSAAQALAVVATGNAARACPPLGPKALSFVLLPRGGARRRRHRRRWLASAFSHSLSAADTALTRLFLDGAASTRAGVALLAGCAASGWAIVPLFCWMAQGCWVVDGGSPSPSPSPSSPSLSTPPWAPTLGLLVGAAHALLSLGLGDDVVLVPALRRARAFAVKRAAAECVRRAVLTAAVAAAVLSLAAGGGGGADAASLASSAASSSRTSAAVALLGAALAAHSLLVGAASVRAAFGERTQFVESGSCRMPTSSSSSFRAAQRVSAAAGAMASANDGLVASIVETSSYSSGRRGSFSSSSSSNPLESSLFDLAVRADAAALAEASAGSSGAWRRAALFADGVGVGSDSVERNDGYDESNNSPFPGAFPGRAWSAVVGGLCLSELAPALAAVGAALLPSSSSPSAAAGAASTTVGAAATGASVASPPRWNERPSAAATARAGAGGGASSVFFAAVKKLASAAASLLSHSSSSKKPPPPSSSTKTPPLPPAVLKAKAATLLRQRWQHLALALRTLGALSAAAAGEDAAGVAQLAGGGGGSRSGNEGGDPTSSSQFFSFHPGTDLGSVLSALLSAAVAFGVAAEPGALPEGTVAGAGSVVVVGGCSAALPPPGLGKLAAALEEEEDASFLHSSSYSSSSPLLRRDAAASALADVALAAAHQAVSRYGKDARRAVLSAQLASPIFGSGVSAAAVAALAEAVLAGRD